MSDYYDPLVRGSNSIDMNGGQFFFAVHSLQTVDGWVGQVFVAGIEVFRTPSAYERPEDAGRNAKKTVVKAFAAVLK